MASTYMERCSTSLVFREIQGKTTKTTIKCHYMVTRMTEIYNLNHRISFPLPQAPIWLDTAVLLILSLFTNCDIPAIMDFSLLFI
jgi:hypothetical protein